MSIEIKSTPATEGALKLVEDLKKILPQDGYFLMGVHEKEMKWDRNIKDISRVNPSSVKDFKEKSTEDLTFPQKMFFGNLHNCTKPENLNSYNKGARIIPDEIDPEVKKIVLMGIKKNTLNQTVVKATCVIFRDYTPEELEEAKEERARLEAKANGFNVGGAEEKITDMFGMLAGSF